MRSACHGRVSRRLQGIARSATSIFGKQLLTLAAVCCWTAQALSAPYHQGFEDDVADWTVADTITRVASMEGTLNLNASDGSYYAELTNDENGYQQNYGNGGYTYYGGRSGTYSGPTVQSLDIYIDTTWAAPARANAFAFILDMAPANDLGASNFAAETNFRFSIDDHNDQVTVKAHGTGLTIATLSQSGWYTFETMFSRGASLTDPIQIALSIYDNSQMQVGTTVIDPPKMIPSLGNAYQSQYLGTGGYSWITAWQNGFADNILAIDNARSYVADVSTVPEPTSMALFGCGALGLLGFRRRRSAIEAT